MFVSNEWAAIVENMRDCFIRVRIEFRFVREVGFVSSLTQCVALENVCIIKFIAYR